MDRPGWRRQRASGHGDSNHYRVRPSNPPEVAISCQFRLAPRLMQPPPTFRGHVEFTPGFAPRPAISHVLFDFDGTLSLVREGWPDVMVPMFVEMLPALPGETPDQRRQLCLDDIMRLNGKQTVYQMIQLADRIRERGGKPREPLWYKHEYLRRLEGRIAVRKDAIRAGQLKPDDLLLHGSRQLLENLLNRGLNLYLASGTDETFVKEEASLLEVTGYFEDRI